MSLMSRDGSTERQLWKRRPKTPYENENPLRKRRPKPPLRKRNPFEKTKTHY